MTYYEAHRESLLVKARERYALTRTAKLAYQKAYAATNREAVQAYKARYRREQAGKVREGLRAWYEANRAYAATQRKAWKAANPGRVYDSNARRRAKLRGAPAERFDVSAIVAAWDGLCGICHQRVDGAYHFDHKVPLSAGGPHAKENLQITHPLCNLRKGTKAA
jgi:5-methylcytosine-specific restriction endonuclease McrA